MIRRHAQTPFGISAREHIAGAEIGSIGIRGSRKFDGRGIVNAGEAGVGAGQRKFLLKFD